MSQTGQCKLCYKHGRLIKQSHVIPNFMYQGIFDENNSITLYPLTNQNEKPKSYQTGFFEKYILCQKCENELFGGLERYSATILYGGNTKNPAILERRMGIDGIRSVLIKNIDYRLFKLFVLSILWRAHVAKNKFFKKIDIPEHEPILRNMLLSGNAGKEGHYKISIIAIKNKAETLIRIFPDPEIKKNDKDYFATFFINGFVYFINLHPQTQFPIFKQSILRETGEIEIPIIEGDLSNKFFKAFGLSDKVANYFT